MERYSRQQLFADIGEEGQRKLQQSHVLVVGCGALGSTQAELMARAGVGRLTLLDRDILELSNLQRQLLYDERQWNEKLPKAAAAAQRIRQINSDVDVRGIVTDVRPVNIEHYLKDVDVVLDGTDNFETRLLLNDACVKHNIPWVYGACVGSYGVMMPILPKRTPCLQCVFEAMPLPGTAQTCDTAGVIGPIVTTISSMQCAEALKILVGDHEAVRRTLLHIDLWDNHFASIKLGAPRENCPACQQQRWEYLQGKHHPTTAVLCGRNTVQVLPPQTEPLDLATIASRLEPYGTVQRNEHLVRCAMTEHTLTLFADGRALVEGTQDPTEARTLYARYIGT
ncbi:MAG: thiazole biosynthesis adenylyltransferase ThiF [Deltaproteobacteria bacterium]|nr:MAG: thiazole biosynthesis adenylyltransferase ThiF [Deltaproteobacteria bacterium]